MYTYVILIVAFLCGWVKGCAFMVSIGVRGGPGFGCVDLGKPFFLLQLFQAFQSPSKSSEEVAVMLYAMPHLILQSVPSPCYILYEWYCQ